MDKKNINKVIFCISSLVCVICIMILFKMIAPNNPDTSQYIIETTTSIINDNVEETVSLPDNPIDFAKLSETNEDVYSWIKIPGTDIDYPVAQSGSDMDDNYYLDHNINKEYEFAGTIYSQKLNSTDYQDFVTVLYGHNMLNGTMFAQLHKFEDKDFFDKHDTIYIYTPGHILTYTVVSAFIYDDRHILNTFNFSKKKKRQEYINVVTNPKSIVRNVREDISVTQNDKILTLSTCAASNTQRYLVQGVLTNDQLTK